MVALVITQKLDLPSSWPTTTSVGAEVRIYSVGKSEEPQQARVWNSIWLPKVVHYNIFFLQTAPCKVYLHICSTRLSQYVLLSVCWQTQLTKALIVRFRLTAADAIEDNTALLYCVIFDSSFSYWDGC